METIAAIALGLIFGGIAGALVILAVKRKGSDGEVELRSKLETATNSLEEAKRISDEYKRDTDELRAQIIERDKEIVQFQTRFEDTQSQYESIESENAALKEQVEQWRKQAADNDNESVKLRANLDASNKRLAERTDIEKVLGDRFKVMANDALAQNSDLFAKTADEKIGALLTQAKTDFSHSKDAVQELVKPLSDELKRIEESRNKSHGSLTQQITALMNNNTKLGDEARNLAQALKRPEVRGSWGEMQLRRVVELAGMSDYCDYEEQVSVTSDDGSRDRPDMVVRMPNERTVVVDAKTPMSAYLTSVESDNPEERKAAILQHAKQVRERASDLSQKSYQRKFDRAPDFVVMFLPGEYLLSAALENDRELIDWAMQRNVIIATPNTLMALLKAVAMGWREAKMDEEAKKIADLGKELHDRLYTFAAHMEKMRSSLNQTVQHFNRGVGSLESRVFASARRFKEHSIASPNELPTISEIEQNPRELRALSAVDIRGDD